MNYPSGKIDHPSQVPAGVRYAGYLRLFRLSVAAPISVAFLLGISDREMTHRPVLVAWLWVLGVLYHAYSCGLNDIADADIDKLNPSRSTSPLPGSLITRQEALLATNLTGIFFLCVPVIAGFPGEVFFGCAVLAALVTWGNLFQKRARYLPTMVIDWFFIFVAGGPVIIGELAAGSHQTQAVQIAAIAFGIQMVLFNVLAGNIKDLEHDTLAGSKTTAIALGVHMQDGRILMPLRYRRYVILLQVLSISALVAAFPAPRNLWVISCYILAAASLSGSTWDIWRTINGSHLPKNGRQLAVILNWLALVIVVGSRQPVVASVSLMLVMLWVPGIRLLEARPVAAPTTASPADARAQSMAATPDTYKGRSA
jgi:4-hydroxybenzoate polyprenyltransferase